MNIVMENLASIEIGTNTIRMLIAKRDSDKPLTSVLRKRSVLRLGSGFNRKSPGIIKNEPMERCVSVLKDYLRIARQYKVSSPISVATGVVRKAKNRREFISAIRDTLGLNTRIISGEEEGRLTLKGVLSSPGMKDSPVIIFDLGGGSTEFIGIKDDSKNIISTELGIITSTEEYLAHDPPARKEIDRLTEHIDNTLKNGLDSFKKIYENDPQLIGTGGTVVTLGAIIHSIRVREFDDKITGLSLNKKAIAGLFNKLSELSSIERLNIKGLDPGREDTILAGCLIAIKIMDYFKKNEIIISYQDLLEGILIDYLQGESDGKETD